MPLRIKNFSNILLYLAIGTVFGIIFTINLNLNPEIKAENNEVKNPDNSSQSQEALNIQNSFVAIAKEAGPAVVSISTVQTRKIAARRSLRVNPFGEEGDSFNKFFNDFFGERPEREYKQSGLGSGVIIDKQGHILTNEHVVGEADEITVTLSDGREFKGKLTGTDPRSDLAIIKIESNNLPVVKLGDSDKLSAGEWAIAIGNPFGFYLKSSEPTITVGVISALHRQLPQTAYGNRLYTDLIQTDAAINPGNSGGPLLNLKGEVVGINVAIFSSTGGYQGVGFAIPINTARFILDKLIKGEKVEYGWLGVSIQDITQDLTDYFHLKDKKGALVIKVISDTPAKEAGLKEDDIIIEFDGKQVENVKQLINMVSRTEVDKKVLLKVLREGREMTLTIKIGRRPDETEEISGAAVSPSNKWNGIEVQNITPEIASKYNISEDKGVLVSNIEAGSIGSWAGLRARDVIYAINKKNVNSVDDFNKITKEIKEGEAVYIRTHRGYITFKVQ